MCARCLPICSCLTRFSGNSRSDVRASPPDPKNVIRSLPLSLCLAGILAQSAFAQARPTGPVIDTIIIDVSNVFAPDEATRGFNRLMNIVHFPTNAFVIRQHLLFAVGDTVNVDALSQTERNLRQLRLFSTVAIDTIRVENRLGVRVETRDAISLTPTIGFSSTGTTVTWALGVTESNLLGSGNRVSWIYRNEVDRNGFDLGAATRLTFGTQVDTEFNWSNWSDGNVAYGLIGDPFRSETDTRSITYVIAGANRRVLQYRTVTTLDTTTYRQTGFINRFDAFVAPVAALARYRRVGFSAQVRREEFVLAADTGMTVPDTITAAVGIAFEMQHADFEAIRPQFNGAGPTEDLDLSLQLRLGVWVAPSMFGYERTGAGPELDFKVGVGGERVFSKFRLKGDGLFTSTGLDSGRVDVMATFGARTAESHWDLIYVTAGAQHNPPPGGEYDLGAGAATAAKGCGNVTLCSAAGRFERPLSFIGPRLYGAHAFTGTRTFWGTYEHRWFLVDDIAGWFGLALAAFFDYGGAWYTDQEPRHGGNAGLGLRLGGIRGIGGSLMRLDLGYTFGDGVTDDGLVVGLGQAFVY